MPKVLSEDQVAAYGRDGILFPFTALAGAEYADCRQKLDALAARDNGTFKLRALSKPHLVLTWLADLICHPAILDPVEDLLGPDILCWGSSFFHKPARDPAYISWHQDSTYWGLSTPDVVTAWVAFSPSTVESGCMRVMPGTHLVEQLPHRDTFHEHNLLSRGQEIEVAVDDKQAVDVVLQPGEMSLHHVRIVHGSEPNRASYPRTGYAIRYVATRVKQIVGERDSATLVRGVDRYGHFEHEPRPQADFHPDAVAYHRAMHERTTDILYAGAAQRPA